MIPVDSTAAGDTFNAALAIVRTEALYRRESLRFADAAATVLGSVNRGTSTDAVRVDAQVFLRRGSAQ